MSLVPRTCLLALGALLMLENGHAEARNPPDNELEQRVLTVTTPPTDVRNRHYVSNREPLGREPLVKLPIGAIRPQGWLRHQLQLAADGLTGRLPELSKWCQIDNSAWVDPQSKEFPWEELPYWLKGFGDLGYVLEDQRIIDETRRWIDGVIATQTPDGYFGPRVNIEEKPKGGYGPISDQKLDLWPNMIMLNVLQSYHEATGDPRPLELMSRYFRWQLDLPAEDILPGYWDRMRGGDNLESIHWLYNRTGEPWLLEAAAKVHRSTARWDEEVVNWHGVNITQGFREPAVWYLQSHDPADRAAAERNYQEVWTKYGQVPGGMFGADENARQGYHDPRQAAETCSIVEFMHSAQMLARLTGELAWLDRCEDVAFNSMPAAFTDDFKALHYLTAPNQPVLSRANKSPGIENRGDMFSYAPNKYRCCQHNHSHGWPYYAEHLWMATHDNGLAAVLYAASSVTAKVGDDGTEVTIHEQTNYPFDESIRFSVRAPREVRFPLLLRIPAWADGASASINGGEEAIEAKAGEYLSIDRTWRDGDRIELKLPMRITVRRWEQNNNAVSIHRGPLAFSLRIEHEARPYWSQEDWQAVELFPTSPWNYGLVLDGQDPAGSIQLERADAQVKDQPWSLESAPVELRARAKRIANWQLGRGDLVNTLQRSPVRSDEPLETVRLIPMGAARLRISAFPQIGEGPDATEWPAPPPLPPHRASFEADEIAAISDGVIPSSSDDHSIPRFTWWPRRGSAEWIIYDMQRPRTVSECRVYWFDDTGRGHCRVPASWRLLWKDDDEWRPVSNASFEIARDRFNTVRFDAVTTDQLKIEVQLQPDYSSGILEWQILP